MPVWNRNLQPWIRQGKLVVLGVAQEQHPDRCRLFAQWHEFDWPILHDPVNVQRLKGVPLIVAIDEQGIVRSVGPKVETLEADFVDRTFPTDAAEPAPKATEAKRPDWAALRRRAEATNSADAWRELGDTLALWHRAAKVDEAIDAYTRALRVSPDDGDAHFRLGVCYRMRYESEQPRPGDFQTAVDHWSKAISIDPNQYIWRRRVQQYGPRLAKPYPFYDWLETAVREIKARGEQPPELRTLPTGSEIAQPARRFETDQEDVVSPDPKNQVFRDIPGLVRIEVAVVPPRIKPGESARVHVTLRPDVSRKVHWNNEGEPLQLWVDMPPGWQVQRRLLKAPQGDKPETTETRHLEFEVQSAADAGGKVELAAYALYYVCEDVGETCRFLRQDIPVTIQVRRTE